MREVGLAILLHGRRRADEPSLVRVLAQDLGELIFELVEVESHPGRNQALVERVGLTGSSKTQQVGRPKVTDAAPRAPVPQTERPEQQVGLLRAEGLVHRLDHPRDRQADTEHATEAVGPHDLRHERGLVAVGATLL